MKEAITHLVTWYQDTLASGGYPLIMALMAMESTFVPVPSEAIIPFAAQRAHATGALTMWGIVLAGMCGSFIGASAMYWISRLAGKPLVLRYGRYIMVPEAKLHAAEDWAARYGALGVFIARLLPVLRQLIGIPMGIVKMDFKIYALVTLLGSAIWSTVLVCVGVAAGNDPRLLKGDMHHVLLWLLGAIIIMGLLHYFVVRRLMAKPAKEL
jgi:membrane protein DedA with SNARE-associated domain